MHEVSFPTKAGELLVYSLGPRGRPGRLMFNEGAFGKGMALASFPSSRITLSDDYLIDFLPGLKLSRFDAFDILRFTPAL